jgi:adenylosuccinate lyase
MLKRYTISDMGEIWSDENKFYLWLKIELAILEARKKIGDFDVKIPRGIIKQIRIDVNEINRIEKESTKHDVVAFLNHISPQLPEELRPWFHNGVTSYDICDTTLGIQLRDSLILIHRQLLLLMAEIKFLAITYKYIPQIGRTHGVHAEPITFGVKLANWHSELERCMERLVHTEKSVSFGKISGAVGMYTIDPSVEKLVCERLSLKPVIATQIVSRDIISEYTGVLSILAGTIGKIATNLRLLSQTEIGEIMESFSKNQKGSSAMPHKKNPISSENISSLMRVVCSNHNVALENQMNCWHERSLDNSGNERVILADSSELMHFSIDRLRKVFNKLSVFDERMKENIGLTKGLIFSQEVMILFAEKSGLPREEAHTIVRDIAMKCWETKEDFLTALLEDDNITSNIRKGDLENCFRISNKLKHVDFIFKKVFG